MQESSITLHSMKNQKGISAEQRREFARMLQTRQARVVHEEHIGKLWLQRFDKSLSFLLYPVVVISLFLLLWYTDTVWSWIFMVR